MTLYYNTAADEQNLQIILMTECGRKECNNNFLLPVISSQKLIGVLVVREELIQH